MFTYRTKHLGKLNHLRALQQQVAFWEQNQTNYKKSCQIFQEYIDALRVFQDPRSLVNGFIRFARFCEKLEDRLYSSTLYSEAVVLMEEFNLSGKDHIEKVLQKIESLRYYY